jgi:cytochrome c oxidase cbb3-type subunit III
MRNVVANGVQGTSMPAFAQRAGGMLTEEQIDAITSGIFSHWGHKQVLDGANPPSYAAKSPETLITANALRNILRILPRI